MSTLNGDGFGVGWYTKCTVSSEEDSIKPCVFTSLKPAWADRNLVKLSDHIKSSLVFAHVRAAGPGSSWPSETHCHPFHFGRFMFMHNGGIGEWTRVRHRFLSLLPPAVVDYAIGSGFIDSVCVFGIILSQLERGPNAEYSPNELRLIMERTLAIVEQICKEENIMEATWLNLVLTDGSCMIATRHVIPPVNKSIKDVQAASLYFASGTSWAQTKDDAPGNFRMVHKDKRNEIVIVTSEPLTELYEEWVPVPKNHILIATASIDVLLYPAPGLCYSLHHLSLSILDQVEKLRGMFPSFDSIQSIKSQIAALQCEEKKDISFFEASPGAPGASADAPLLSSTKFICWIPNLRPITRFLSFQAKSEYLPYLEALGFTPSTTTIETDEEESNENLISQQKCFLFAAQPKKIDSPARSRSVGQSLEILRNTGGSNSPAGAARLLESVFGNTTPPQSIQNSFDEDPIPLLKVLCPLKPTALLSVATFTIWSSGKSASMESIVSLGSNNGYNLDRFRYCLTGTEDGEVAIWSIDDGMLRKRLRSNASSGILTLCLVEIILDDSTRQLFLFTGNSDTSLCVYDLSYLLEANESTQSCCHPVWNNQEITIDRPVLCLRFAPLQGDVLSLALSTVNGKAKLFIGFQTTAVAAIYLTDILTAISWMDNQTRASTTCRRSMMVGLEPPVVMSPVKCKNTRLVPSVENRIIVCHVLDSHDEKVPFPYETPFCKCGASTPTLSCRVLEAPRHCGYVESLVTCGPYMCSGGGDGLVLVWKDCKYVSTLLGHSGGVLCLAADAPCTLYSGSRDKTIRVWDLDTFSCRHALTGHSGDVMCLAIAGGCLISGSSNGEVFCWDRTTWVLRQTCTVESPVFRSTKPFNAPAITSLCVLQHNNERSFAAWSRGTVAPVYVDSKGIATQPNQKPPWSSLSNQGVPLEVLSTASDGLIRIWTLTDVPILKDTENEPTDMIMVHSSGGPDNTTDTFVAFESILRPLVALKTISGRPSFSADCWAAAKFIMGCFERLLKAQVQLVDVGPGRAPLIYARLGSDPSKRTVLFYSHYDVVPATLHPDGLRKRNTRNNGWVCDPWSLTTINGHYYGRGTSDNKGPLLAQLFSVLNLETGTVPKDLPVNVIWLCEGEEESGSVGFEAAIRRLQKVKVDTVICTNSYWIDDERPCIVTGMRGVIDLTLTIETASEAFGYHSGIHGGAVPEPLVDLMTTVASLFDQNGKVAIPGFYDSVSPKSSIDRSVIERGNNDLVDLQRRWLEPVLSVTEIWSSNQKECSSTEDMGHIFRVIPAKASCNLSIRTVPDQQTKVILDNLIPLVQSEFEKKKKNPRHKLSIQVVDTSPWWTGDSNAEVFNDACAALKEAWNVQPLIVREGGTMPVLRFLQDFFEAPVLQLPLGQSTDSAHLPNERIRIVNLRNGVKALQKLLYKIGAPTGAIP